MGRLYGGIVVEGNNQQSGVEWMRVRFEREIDENEEEGKGVAEGKVE